MTDTTTPAEPTDVIITDSRGFKRVKNPTFGPPANPTMQTVKPRERHAPPKPFSKDYVPPPIDLGLPPVDIAPVSKTLG